MVATLVIPPVSVTRWKNDPSEIPDKSAGSGERFRPSKNERGAVLASEDATGDALEKSAGNGDHPRPNFQQWRDD